MEVLLFNLSLNLLLRGFPSEPSYLTEHYITKPYFIKTGLVALVTSCSGTRFHFVKAHYVSPVSKLFTLAYRLLPFRLTSRSSMCSRDSRSMNAAQKKLLLLHPGRSRNTNTIPGVSKSS